MFANKARAYLNGVSFRCSPLGRAPGLTSKHCTRLERPTGTNHFSLFGQFVSYNEKSFVNTSSDVNVVNIFDLINVVVEK
jgi:hypothetical protein